MTDYQKIRIAVEHEGKSQREVARQFRHGRDTIRKVLADQDTRPRHRREKPAPSPLDPFRHIIDEWLDDEAARKVPRKQRSDAIRIQKRLQEEHGYAGSVYPVRRHLKARARRLNPRDVFFTLEFGPAEEAQVDWGQASVILGAGGPATVHLFCYRLAYSRAAFVRAYPCEKIECFLDGHVRAFRFFDGVPKRCCYDNLRSAVIQVGKGRERRLNEHFRRLLAHYPLQTRFCNVDSGNEKGRVENLVKLAQRDFLAGAPRFADLDALNAHLERCCRDDLARPAPHAEKTRGELLEEERPLFHPLVRGDGPAYTQISTFAGKDSLVQFERSFYSVPVAHAFAKPMLVRGYADRVEVWKDDGRVAVHPRRWEAGKFELDFLHFIPLLEAKPGALANARTFKGSPWGEDFARFRAELGVRNPEGGERDFVELLLLFTEYPEAEVKRAVAECARSRAWSVSSVRLRLNFSEPAPRTPMDVSAWPELSVDTDGVRPASEYDAALLTPAADGEAPVPEAPLPAEDLSWTRTEAGRYDECFVSGADAQAVSDLARYDIRRGWRGGPGA